MCIVPCLGVQDLRNITIKTTIRTEMLAMVLMAACSGGGSLGTNFDILHSDGFAVDLSSMAETTDNKPVPDSDEPETAPEVPVAETAEETTVTDVPIPEGTCSQPELASCPDPLPAPTGDPAIQEFVAANAIPLQCDGSKGMWDFTVFLREFQEKQVMVLGEIHGSNEIGPDSADLAEHLVRHAEVDTWVLEIGMDTTEALNQYAKTGDAAAANTIGFQMYGDNMFRRVLAERAWTLHQEGIDVHLVGIDVPQRLAWVNEQIETMASGVSDQTVKGLVLDTLPPPREIDSYGMLGLETAYVNQSKAYHQHVTDNLDEICSVFEPDDCEWLEKLSLGLWTGAVMVSQDFMMAMMTGQGSQELFEMLKIREELVKYLFEKAIESRPGRVYAHMGAAHAGKGTWTVSSHLDEVYFADQDAVYTITPAIGTGSQVFYGFMSQPVSAEPSVIASALAPMPQDRYFLAADEPGQDCAGSPFMAHPIPELPDAFYGVAYDAFVWFRKLTGDVPSGLFYSAPSWKQRFFRNQITRLQHGNRLMMKRDAW